MVFGILGATGLGLQLLAYAGGRRSPRAVAGLTVLLTALLCGKAVLAARADWEWWLLPWPGYAFVQGFLLYALAAAFFGVAAAALPTRWNRAVVFAAGVAVLGHGLHRHAWIAWPESHGDGRTPDIDHHMQQSTHYTCGPAACAAALSRCGVSVSERDLATACLTRSSGSTLFDLYRGVVVTLGNRPIAVSIEQLDDDDLAARELIAVGSTPGGGHALCIAITGGKIVVHDPLRPHACAVTRDELRERFRPPAIVLRRLTRPEFAGARPGG